MKKLILLTILFASSLLLMAQAPDSCICYTDEMDKKALECLVNAPKKDSLIQNLSLQLHNSNKIAGNLTVINNDILKQNNDLIKENNEINLHLEKVKNRTIYIGVGCFSLGVGTAIYLYKKVVQ